ncbi:LytTR family DNA-binding domain-containing protein [Sphingomonas sp. DT-207]|uniref:LytTR family DNA-binding domain-containing protein n=1 Tax=Sphingomonas sp. DT-207 TaxID=3396167 RepID=UPI003F1C8F69
MTENAAGTNGGEAMTSGARLRRQRAGWLLAAFLLFVTVQSIANVESTLEDFAKAGIAEQRWHVWTWQLSSLATWIALMVPLWWLVAWARPPRLALPAAILIHAAATVPVSLVHVLVMVGIRKLAYMLAGESYGFGDWPMALLYEYRKDVATYLMVVAFLIYAQWLLARPAPAEGERARVLLVPDGSVTHRVPIEAIDWAASAGNYVEIAWEGRLLLHRSTLAALAEQLGPNFARIHRGRLVRRDAVRSIETDKSGDFTVTLASGAALRGSRRYRTQL